MSVQTISPETWDDLVARLALFGQQDVVLAWIAIEKDGRWIPFALSVRIPEAGFKSVKETSRQIRLGSELKSPSGAAQLLQTGSVGAEDVEPFSPQLSFTAYWVDPETEWGTGARTGWPEYQAAWPLVAVPDDLRWGAYWQMPFSVGSVQYRSLTEAAFAHLHGRRYPERGHVNIQPEVSVTAPYPYRLGDIETKGPNLSVQVDWARTTSRPEVSVLVNWRLRSDQPSPAGQSKVCPPEGGAVGFELDGDPVEITCFLRDEGVPVLCHTKDVKVGFPLADRVASRAAAATDNVMDRGSVGIVTFLLTDVVQSTQLRLTHGDELINRCILRSQAIIEEAVAAHGGDLVQSRGEGDSTFSTFPTPRQALTAALKIQAAHHAESWPDQVSLRVRAAIHSGESPGDYQSVETNFAARLRAEAGPSEVLVSGAAEALARRHLPEGMSLVSLGKVRIKDFPESEVYQLHGPAGRPPSQPGPSVFISYSTQDTSAVEQLARQLADAGVPVWSAGLNLRPGDVLAQEISDAITRARIVVIGISRHSNLSNWVSMETSAALARAAAGEDLTVIPVLLEEGVRPPALLRGYLYLDASSEEAMASAVERIASLADASTREGRHAEEQPIHEPPIDPEPSLIWLSSNADDEQSEITSLTRALWTVTSASPDEDLRAQLVAMTAGTAVVAIHTDEEAAQRDDLLRRLPADQQLAARTIVFYDRRMRGDDFEVLSPLAIFSVSSRQRLIELFTRYRCATCGRPIVDQDGGGPPRPCPRCRSTERVVVPLDAPRPTLATAPQWRWLELDGPAARVDHAMVADPTGGIVLFGGASSTYLSDTWRFANEQWEYLRVQGPPARAQHGLAFDSSRGSCLLFGGSSPHGYLDDTWLWDGRSWRQLNGPGPGPRSQFGLCFDSRRSRFVLFGGVGDHGRGLRDTWEWDGEWRRVADEVGPAGFYAPGMAYDADRDVCVLVGGNGLAGYSPTTWEWDGSVWLARDVAEAPEPRAAFAITYVSAFKGIVLHGGSGGQGSLGDSWLLTSGGWQRIAAVPAPDARQDHAMAEIPASGDALLFGGQSNGLRADSWMLVKD